MHELSSYTDVFGAIANSINSLVVIFLCSGVESSFAHKKLDILALLPINDVSNMKGVSPD
jgi:hypothetical protein